MKILLVFFIVFTLSGCTTTYNISSRPSSEVLERIRLKHTSKDIIHLEIDQKTKELRVTRAPSTFFGYANRNAFNIGEAFSGRLSEISRNVFVNEVSNPTTVHISLDYCDLLYANSPKAYDLAWASIYMTVSVKYSTAQALLKESTYKYHSRYDVPMTERGYGVRADKAANSAVDDIVEQLLSDILSDMNGFKKIS